MERVDCVVIGAGVVGLACARALALAGREVLILEAGPAFGTGISSRSSEVIHAGLYYPPGSLKAALCVRGRDLLYAYCASRHVPHRRCGKLVVATGRKQLAELDAIAQRAAANGVRDLRRIDATEAREREPQLRCLGALHSPSTGIVDSHALMLALLGDAEHAGATLVVNTPVLGAAAPLPGIAGTPSPTGVAPGAGTGPDRAAMAPAAGEATDGAGILLETGGEMPMRLVVTTVVNAAGLAAPSLAAHISGLPTGTIPKPRFAKGSYFSLQGRTPFSTLIYPVPEPGGLGVHLTLDLQGRARFGPDVEWLDGDRLDVVTELPDPACYRVDPARATAFYAAIRRYWPALPEGALQPDYAGIRPKIVGPDEAAADFRIDGPAVHGVPGLVNLFGIESPGLTACLAIAERVVQQTAPAA